MPTETKREYSDHRNSWESMSAADAWNMAGIVHRFADSIRYVPDGLMQSIQSHSTEELAWEAEGMMERWLEGNEDLRGYEDLLKTHLTIFLETAQFSGRMRQEYGHDPVGLFTRVFGFAPDTGSTVTAEFRLSGVYFKLDPSTYSEVPLALNQPDVLRNSGGWAIHVPLAETQFDHRIAIVNLGHDTPDVIAKRMNHEERHLYFYQHILRYVPDLPPTDRFANALSSRDFAGFENLLSDVHTHMSAYIVTEVAAYMRSTGDFLLDESHFDGFLLRPYAQEIARVAGKFPDVSKRLWNSWHRTIVALARRAETMLDIGKFSLLERRYLGEDIPRTAWRQSADIAEVFFTVMGMRPVELITGMGFESAEEFLSYMSDNDEIQLLPWKTETREALMNPTNQPVGHLASFFDLLRAYGYHANMLDVLRVPVVFSDDGKRKTHSGCIQGNVLPFFPHTHSFDNGLPPIETGAHILDLHLDDLPIQAHGLFKTIRESALHIVKYLKDHPEITHVTAVTNSKLISLLAKSGFRIVESVGTGTLDSLIKAKAMNHDTLIGKRVASQPCKVAVMTSRGFIDTFGVPISGGFYL